MRTSPPGDTLNPDGPGSGLWAGLNQLPEDLLATSGRLLAAMSTEPALTRARREMLNGLGLEVGSRVLEAGCGNGAALGDVLPLIGGRGHLVGVDATRSFVTEAQAAARRLGAAQAEYQEADVCHLPFAAGSFDAAFCDKLLVHVRSAREAVGELVRVTRQGGRVGAVEWMAHLSLSTARPEHEAGINIALRQSARNFSVGPYLARIFR